MAHNTMLMQLQRLTIAPAAWFTEWCLLHHSVDLLKAGRKVVCTMYLYSACIMMVHSSPDQGWEGSLHLVPSLSPSCAEITAHAIISAVVERQKREERHPYFLDIHLITTRLSTATNRHVVNRFATSLFDSAQCTSRCAAPYRARMRPWTFRAWFPSFTWY